MLITLATVLKPAWADLSNEKMLIMQWGGYAFKTGFQAMIIGSGLLAAYFRQRIGEHNGAFTNFGTFVKAIPPRSWYFWLLATAIICLIHFIAVHGYFTRYRQDINASVFRRVSSSTYLPWFYDLVDLAGVVLPYLFAAILYIKTANLRFAGTWRPVLASLLITGFAGSTLISAVYFQLESLILKPLMFLASNEWIAFFLSYLLQAGIYMSYMLLSAFLVHGAFSSAEDPVDFEAATHTADILPIQD
ncbi:hypothetical protein [Chitinophaga sp.]|uniref:hypothetical protein n=1 Tax=Chitinophaga sp. TaxID=1869181 RepID=UPI0031E04DE8